jgi:hypothetical protein
MADKHPYAGTGVHLVQAIVQLRKSFPSQVTVDTLKKWSIASNNEGRLINCLKFLKVIDDEGKKTPDAGRVFSIHGDDEFDEEFGKLVHSAYGDLFSLFSDEAWTLSQDKLISFFRTNDQSTAQVGKLQAATFQTLASVVKKLPAPTRTVSSEPQPKTPKSKERRTSGPLPAATPIVVEQPSQPAAGAKAKSRDFALTVRIEINLPKSEDQKTYDLIFKSIRENLLNGE